MSATIFTPDTAFLSFPVCVTVCFFAILPITTGMYRCILFALLFITGVCTVVLFRDAFTLENESAALFPVECRARGA